MSVKLMSKAWEMDIPSGQKMVLLALCDHANDEGVCYPSREKLAQKCSMGKTALYKHISWLEANGFISSQRRQKGGSRLSDLYQIHPEKLTGGHSKSKRSQSEHSHSEHSDSEPSNIHIPNGEHSDSEPTYKEEPSKNRHIEPSEITRKRVTAREAKPKKSGRHETELAMLAEHGVTGQLATDHLLIRKAKRLPLTQTALDGMIAEAKKAGLSLEQAVRYASEHSWGSFRADWFHNAQQQHGGRNDFVPTAREVKKITQGGVMDMRTGEVIAPPDVDIDNINF